MNALSPELCEIVAERGRQSLYVMAKWILGYKDMTERVHLPLCRLLENESLSFLAMELPRGFFKSSLCSIAYPIWCAVRNPDVRILVCQNTYVNAIKKLKAINDHFMYNDVFRALYRGILPTTKSVWRSDSMCVLRKSHEPESTFEAAGVGTATTSRHYDIIVEDDTVAPDQDELGEDAIAPTSDQIEKAIGLHRILTGLQSHPTKSRRLVVGTRWFEHDLLSHIRDKEPFFQFYRRSALENAQGESDRNGQPTFPERFSNEALNQLEEQYGKYIFSCLYLNKPVCGDQTLFKPEYFIHNNYETPPVNLVTYTTVDPAGDPEESLGRIDFNVVMTAGKCMRTGNIYVLHYDRVRCNPGELIELIIKHNMLFRPVRVGVESVQYQQSILYYLRERKKQEFMIFPVEKITSTKKSKNLRISGLEPLFRAGKIFLRPHMQELKKELLSFPIGRHDDAADALAMQLPMWRETPTITEEQKLREADQFSFERAEAEIMAKHSRKQDLASLYSREMSLYDMPTNVRRAVSSIRSNWASRDRKRRGSPAHVGR